MQVGMVVASEATKVTKNEKEIAYYDRLHSEKYRDKDQSFEQHSINIACEIASDELHQDRLYDAIINHRFLAAGRFQAATGAVEREVSPFNCSVSQKIEDSMDSIMEGVHRAALILRLGTGIGFNFSHLRPAGDMIKKLGTESTGPLLFMEMYDIMAKTIASAGHRRGAMMAVMNIDHPDIEKFIDAKMEKDKFRQFNFSVGVTDAFMKALALDEMWELKFNGKIYDTIRASYLWERIMRNAYNSAEPGVLFIDRFNSDNNLYYCEHIEATNPCSEQPLPPNGLCLLGSFNLPKYLERVKDGYAVNYDTLKQDIHAVVEGYDNIFEDAVYAVPEHKMEAMSKRRMGLGFTGIANCIELMLATPCYGSDLFCDELDSLCSFLANEAYRASALLAKERGAFPLYDKDKYLNSSFLKRLDDATVALIEEHGIRNSHLISYAPCGTISQTASNVSSGVEPVFFYKQKRKVHMKHGQEEVVLNDYNVREYNFYGKTLEDCSIEDHLNVAEIIQRHTDSAVSKTVNVPSNCSYDDYDGIYRDAFNIGLKGITVFRPTELRGAVIVEAEDEPMHCSITGECTAE